MKRISDNSGRDRIDGFEKYNLRRKKRTIWTAAGCVLAALMVVGISFAMRSQGRALEPEKRILKCSYTVHQHTHDEPSCYDETDNLICGMADYVIHYHNDDCYVEKNLVCQLPEPQLEWEAHTHTSENDCYDADGNLTCEMLVADVHIHDENCFQIVKSVSPEATKPVTTEQGTTNPGMMDQETTNPGTTEQEIKEPEVTEQETEEPEVTEEENKEPEKTEQETEEPKKTEEENKEPDTPKFTYTETSRTYEDDKIKIEVFYPESAGIPDQAELVVEPLTGSDYDAALAQAAGALKKELDAKFDPGAVAYDISFVYEDKDNGVKYVFEPADGVMTVTFHFKDGAYENGDDLTIIHMGEDQIDIYEDVKVNDGKSEIGVGSFSPFVFGTTRPVNAQDISAKVESVEFSTKQGSIWIPKYKDADGKYSFSSDDSVKAKITCTNIEVNKLGSGAYIPLPKSISFPKEMMGKTVEYSDRDYPYPNAGAYQLSYDTDGTPCAVFQFTDEYLKWVRQNRGGLITSLFFEFEFTWDLGQTNGQEVQEKIHIGDFEGTVKIKTKDESNNSNQNLGYNAYKNVKETKYENGKMLITYEIYVNVGSHLEKMIELYDEITRGTEFYDLKWQYSGNGGQHNGDYVKLTNDSDTKKTITIGNTSGVDAGYYTISYTASFDVGVLQNAQVDSVKNTITYGDGKYHSSTDKDTRTNSMTKNGAVENVNTGEVKWTVRINDGNRPYTFKEDESFADTLPAGTSLVDNTMVITQYDANWNKIENTIAWQAVKQQDGTTLITATLPKGPYRYQIEYMTKQDVPPEPGVQTKVKNEAKISGDITHETSAEVTMKPEAITKTMGDVPETKKSYTKNGETLQVFEIPWSVALASVKEGDEYTDMGLEADWVVPLLMSPEQINKIVVKCADNPDPLVKGTDYDITAPNDNGNFLFKIKFLKPQTGKVTIDYTCYANVTNIAGDGVNVRNVFGTVEAGGWIKNSSKAQSNNLFKYVEGSPGVDEWNRYTDSKISIGMNNTLKWVIVAKPDCVPDTPLVFKDTLPKGLRFKDGSLKITAEWDIDVGSDYYQYKIEKDSNGNDVITLTVDIAKKTIKHKDYSKDKLERLVITYETLITDTDFLTGSELSKVYTNKVEWDNNEVEQNVTVTRDVIGKYGSFNASTGMLRYSVIINPNGAALNPNGNLLRVEDTLTDRRGIEFKLGGVKLYNLTNASDGSGKVPGSEIATLQPLSSKPANDSSAKEYTYYYDEKTYTITAFIPDKTGCALVYDYQIMSDVAEDIYVSNKASLYGGSNSYGSTQDSTKVLKFSMGAGVNTDALNLSLEKRDAAYNDKLLAGAEFTVSKWDGLKWVEDKVYTTGENGSVALSSLEPNVLYKVEETKAPEGYAINPEIKYFMFANDSAKVSVPDGVKDVTLDDITIYQYGKDQNGKAIPPSVMEWKDNRLGTDLLVTKVWKDGSQNPIERLNGKLTFDLYRKEVPIEKASGYTEGRTYIYKLTDEELEMLKKKEDYETYKTLHNEEYVGEYTIETSEGKWDLLIQNLPKTDTSGKNVYQYYLVETSMDTLSGNDQWLGVEYTEIFDTDKNMAGITVTNSIVSDYSLPETGAEGSWTDRIVGWFQERYQKIIHYFNKED